MVLPEKYPKLQLKAYVNGTSHTSHTSVVFGEERLAALVVDMDLAFGSQD
jgi:hypothetical protein